MPTNQLITNQTKFLHEVINNIPVRNKILQLDQRINRLVYGLYGLTEEEIAMVEKEIGGKNKKYGEKRLLPQKRRARN